MKKISTSFYYTICLQIKYNLQTFIPKLKWSILDTYFENLEVQSAEDNVCNFERDYKIFYDDFRCEIFVFFFSSRSLKMREKYISFAQLVLLSLYIF